LRTRLLPLMPDIALAALFAFAVSPMHAAPSRALPRLLDVSCHAFDAARFIAYLLIRR